MVSPLSKRLKKARLLAKISQKKLGILAGMDAFSASARMNHYEIGRHTPDYSTLKRISKILNVPPAYFYAEEEDLAEMICLFSTLKPQERAKALKAMNGYVKKLRN